MRSMNKVFVFFLIFLAVIAVPGMSAETRSDGAAAGGTLINDSLAINRSVLRDSVGELVDSVPKKRNIFKKISDYFAKSNQYDPTKKMDFTVIGGPFYASATGLGLGLVASGLYTLDRNDRTLPLSNLSIFSNVATSGMLMVGVRGNNVFPKEKYRLDYSMYVYTFPTKLWGIGYDAGDVEDNETTYSRVKFEFKPKFLFRLFEHAYIGPAANFQYVKVSDMDEKAIGLVGTSEKRFITTGAGATFVYDSRDIITGATKGWFFQLEQLFYPSFFGNDYHYYMTDVTLATYQKAWKGAVIAGEFHSLMNFKDVPWPMLATAGGPNRMRGYYEGRYRDKSIVEAQIELRQHIKRRNGAVLWVGVANLFPEFDQMRLRKTLWNAGVGYRWAFKQGVNVRLDLGFTKNGVGFAFNINEAF